MFLNFIGSGSALNTVLGNNSAFVKEGKSILLLDCGSTTFSKIQSLKLLENVKDIYVLITHRHPDHISSLGDLVFYAQYIIKSNITIISPDSDNIAILLKYMGVHHELYSLIKLEKQFKLKNLDFEIDIDFVPVQHVEDMECYGYIISYQNTKVFYSGDAKDIPDIILQLFEKQELDYIYQDVCSYDYSGNPHMYIEKLSQTVESVNRKRLFCMHYDEKFDRSKAIQEGFRLVNNYEQ
jgi:ribonuclease BN (tRNA processing enzyme)